MKEAGGHHIIQLLYTQLVKCNAKSWFLGPCYIVLGYVGCYMCFLPKCQNCRSNKNLLKIGKNRIENVENSDQVKRFYVYILCVNQLITH